MKRLAIIPFLFLTACAGKPDPLIVDTSCSWVKPIFINKADKLTHAMTRLVMSSDTSQSTV